jgi:hypothetical protein
VVDWRACLDPAARHIEVHSTHVGMAVNSAVYYVLSKLLAPSASAEAPLAAPAAGLAAA